MTIPKRLRVFFRHDGTLFKELSRILSDLSWLRAKSYMEYVFDSLRGFTNEASPLAIGRIGVGVGRSHSRGGLTTGGECATTPETHPEFEMLRSAYLALVTTTLLAQGPVISMDIAEVQGGRSSTNTTTYLLAQQMERVGFAVHRARETAWTPSDPPLGEAARFTISGWVFVERGTFRGSDGRRGLARVDCEIELRSSDGLLARVCETLSHTGENVAEATSRGLSQMGMRIAARLLRRDELRAALGGATEDFDALATKLAGSYEKVRARDPVDDESTLHRAALEQLEQGSYTDATESLRQLLEMTSDDTDRALVDIESPRALYEVRLLAAHWLGGDAERSWALLPELSASERLLEANPLMAELRAESLRWSGAKASRLVSTAREAAVFDALRETLPAEQTYRVDIRKARWALRREKYPLLLECLQSALDGRTEVSVLVLDCFADYKNVELLMQLAQQREIHVLMRAAYLCKRDMRLELMREYLVAVPEIDTTVFHDWFPGYELDELLRLREE